MVSATAVKKIVHILSPTLKEDSQSDELANFKVASSMLHSRPIAPAGQVMPALNEKSVTTLADLLMQGNKDGALRFACDQGLWAHALLIASRISPQIWGNVVQEFAASELQAHSDASQRLKFMYQSFARTGDNCKSMLVMYMQMSDKCSRRIRYVIKFICCP